MSASSNDYAENGPRAGEERPQPPQVRPDDQASRRPYSQDSEQKQEPRPVLYCSFCPKNQTEVVALIAGPNGVHICDECVQLCLDCIFDMRRENYRKAQSQQSSDLGSKP
jgi:hypothetical protein